MKKIQIITVILLAAVMLVPAEAFSEGWFGRGPAEHREKGDPDARMAEDLGLTAQQEKELATSRIDDRRERKAIGEQLKAKRDELQDELKKDKVDQDRINKIADEMKALMGKGLDRHIASLVHIKEVLTPEQFSKFLEISKKRPKHGRGGHKMDPEKKE